MSKKFLVVIAGPTAIGKTTMSIKLATALETEIISCDSRQIYKELDIGVAKPSAEELAQAPHHFINHINLEEKYSAGRYEREATKLIEEHFETHDFLIMTGGTGLYINAVLYGLDEFPEVDDATLQHYNLLYESEGIATLQNELKLKDPVYFEVVDIENPRRLIRALSVISVSGQTFSSFRNQKKKERDFEFIGIRLTMNRDELYERINTRVDQMMASGLLDEVKSLQAFSAHRSLDTVGYTELLRHLDGAYDLKEAIRLIKRNTRRYAKRQITWLNNQSNFSAFPNDSYDEILEYIKTQSEF